MIKLEKGNPPDFLTPERQDELTDRYKRSLRKSKVWNDPKIREQVLEESHSKCVYCECLINDSGSGLEVDHYRPSSQYPDLVVDWDNLLASCSRCNGKKGNKEGVLNPFVDDPRLHISQHGYRLYEKSALGKQTIKILYLNDRVRLVNARFEIGDKVQSRLDELAEEQDITEVRNTLTDILQECQPESEFSAIAASALHEHPRYLGIIERLKAEGEFDDELESLHQSSLTIKLDKRQ